MPISLQYVSNFGSKIFSPAQLFSERAFIYLLFYIWRSLAQKTLACPYQWWVGGETNWRIEASELQEMYKILQFKHPLGMQQVEGAACGWGLEPAFLTDFNWNKLDLVSNNSGSGAERKMHHSEVLNGITLERKIWLTYPFGTQKRNGHAATNQTD